VVEAHGERGGERWGARVLLVGGKAFGVGLRRLGEGFAVEVVGVAIVSAAVLV
jgi:hypothetical protein